MISLLVIIDNSHIDRIFQPNIQAAKQKKPPSEAASCIFKIQMIILLMSLPFDLLLLNHQ